MVISIEGGPTCEEMDLARTKPTKSKSNTTDTENSENINIEGNDESGVQDNDVERNSQENMENEHRACNLRMLVRNT